MHRRQYLALTTTVAAAGCTSSFLSSEEYEKSDKEAMILGVDEFPDDWQRNDDLNDNYDAVFHNGDETLAVLISVEIYESVGGAEDRFDSMKERSDAHEFSIADEAFWSERTEVADVGLRDSNAVGQCSAMRQSGLQWIPDRTRAQDYAEVLYEHWQTI